MGITTDQIIEAALDRLTAEYIFADQAEQIAALVRGRLAEGRTSGWPARRCARR